MGSERQRSRLKWVPLIGFVAVPLVIVTGVILMIERDAGPARTSPSNMIATGVVGDRHVAVVAYETDTFPHIDLFRIGSIGYSVQAQAFDLDTGEPLWDTMLSNDHPSIGAEALAVGGDHAYVRTDQGLVILDAESGRIVARGDEITGLGENAVASRNAYVWDDRAEQIVLLDDEGGLHAIPLGSDTARPAAPDVAERWRAELNAQDAVRLTYSESTWNATRDRAPLPGPQPEPDPLTGIVPEDNILSANWGPEDAWTTNVVIDQDTGFVAGSEFGFAVSESNTGHGYTFRVADLETRMVQAEYETDSGSGIVTVAVDPGGYVVMVIPGRDQQAHLVVATADGIIASPVGERGWFGT